MSKFKVGDIVEVVQTSDPNYYSVGACGKIVNLGVADLKVQFTSGTFSKMCEGTWYVVIDDVVLVGKKQKEWKKITEKRLLKLEVGDKVLLRSGVVATVTEVRDPVPREYPIVHNRGDLGGYHAVTNEGKSCLGMDGHDVVKVPNKKYKGD